MKEPVTWVKLSKGVVTCEQCKVSKPLSEIGMFSQFVEAHRYCRMPETKQGKRKP